ncbi:hypothetical protein DMENIID0001_089070 [Sergentomyia squamirostris]
MNTTEVCIAKDITLHKEEAIKKNAFECYFCLASFSREELWQQHILVHGNQQTFECPDCSAVFSEFSKFLKHMVVDHKSPGTDNQDTTVVKEEVQEEDVLHSPERDSEEKELPSPPGTKYEIEEYILPSNEYVESEEDNKIVPKEETPDSDEESDKISPFPVEICSVVISPDPNIKDHKKKKKKQQSRQGRTYKCTTCNEIFEKRYALTKHQKIHGDECQYIYEKPFTCEACGKSFRRADTLANHTKHFCKSKTS